LIHGFNIIFEEISIKFEAKSMLYNQQTIILDYGLLIINY